MAGGPDQTGVDSMRPLRPEAALSQGQGTEGIPQAGDITQKEL